MYMAPRNDIDLWLILTDPKEARDYIKNFDWRLPIEMQPSELMLDSGRVIHFKSMSDSDAVVAALELLRSVEIPEVMREKNIAKWEH